MTTDINALQKELCRQFCTDIKVSFKNDKLIRIETPFYFPDGDPYQIYLTALETGGFRVTDMGHTLMQLSYENNIELLKKGSRGNLLEQIQLEFGLKDDDGAFYLESPIAQISENIFKFGQGITKIYDLTFLNRVRVENTFYEDLKEFIFNIIDEKKIIQNYTYAEMEKADDYPIDYKIEGIDKDLLLFGIGGNDKAKLTTIILERLERYSPTFESLIVFQDFDAIPKNDVKRLMNVAGEMIASLDAKEDIKRKIRKRVSMQ